MIVYDVFSKRQSIATYTLKELSAYIHNGQVTLRQVNNLHVRAIKKYILENVLTEQLYFPPIVANVDTFGKEKPHEFTIIDGSQRLSALIQVEEMGNRSIKSEQHEEMKRGYKLLHYFQQAEIAVQIFEGLSKEESDQLYIDLNTKGKKVALSKRIAFDSRKELNIITNSVLSTNTKLAKAGVEIEKRAVVRPANKKLLSLSQLRQIVAIFLTGKMVFRTAEERYDTYLDEGEYVKLINTWFDELFRLYPPERIGDFHISMLANHSLLVSIAYFANKGLGRTDLEAREQTLKNRMRSLAGVDFMRANPIWEEFKGISRGGYYYLANDKANIEAIVSWLEKQGG